MRKGESHKEASNGKGGICIGKESGGGAESVSSEGEPYYRFVKHATPKTRPKGA